ncbi:MAG: anti-sigma factor domain-containing protein [Angustibacter sp.]
MSDDGFGYEDGEDGEDGVTDDDELTGLVRGELSREELAAAVARLRGSDDARLALVETVAAHSALTAAARTLRGTQRTPAPPAAEPPLPPLDLPRRSVRRPRWVAAAVAAAVVLVAGIATVTGWRWVSSTPSRPPVAVRSVSLQPVSAASASGEVTMADEPASRSVSRTRMRITTSGLAPAGPGRFYYAWLFDPQTNKMLPLGLVSAGSASQFEVSDEIVARYHAVDISLQDDNGDPRHSATSVLRAAY